MLPSIDQPINWVIGIPVFMLVLMSAVFFHELGHFVTAKLAGVKVEEFALGFPPRLFSFKRGETVYALNLLPLGGYCRMVGEEDPTQPRSFARASKRWRAIILLAGVTMNMIFSVFLFTAAFMTGEPTMSGDVTVNAVTPNSAAAEAGILKGDVIREVNSKPVTTAEELLTAIRSTDGKSATFTVERNSARQTISVTPRYNEAERRYMVGIAPTVANGVRKVNPRSFGDSLQLGARTTMSVVGFTVDLPRRIFAGQATAEETRPIGLPGVASATADATTAAVYSGWWFPVFFLAGLLNVGLALANILPLPALDGGRLVFVAVEALRGRRISPEKEGLIHLIGFGVLLTLMLFFVVMDITNPIPRIWVER